MGPLLLIKYPRSPKLGAQMAQTFFRPLLPLRRNIVPMFLKRVRKTADNGQKKRI